MKKLPAKFTGSISSLTRILLSILFILSIHTYAKDEGPYTLPGASEGKLIWTSDELGDKVNNIEVISETILLATGKATYTLARRDGKLVGEGFPSPVKDKIKVNNNTMILVGDKDAVLMSTLNGQLLQPKMPPLPYTLVMEIAPNVILIGGETTMLISALDGTILEEKLLPKNVSMSSLEKFAPNTVAVLGVEEDAALISTENGAVIASTKENKLLKKIFKQYKDPADNPLKAHDVKTGYAVIHNKDEDQYQQYDMSRFQFTRELKLPADVKVEEIFAVGEMLLFQFKERDGQPDWNIFSILSGEKQYEGKYKFGHIQTIANTETFENDGYLQLVCGNKKENCKLVKFDMSSAEQSKLLDLTGALLNSVFYNDGKKLFLKSARYGAFFANVYYSCVDLQNMKELYAGEEKIKWDNAINLIKVLRGGGRGKNRAYPLQFDPDKDLVYQAANESERKKNMMIVGKPLNAEPLRWYYAQKAESHKKMILGSKHTIMESVKPGIFWSGQIFKVD